MSGLRIDKKNGSEYILQHFGDSAIFIYIFIYILFDIAQKSNTPHNPVARADVAFKVNRANVVEIGPSRLPIYRALVQTSVLSGRCVDCIHVDNRHLLKQHLGLRLHQLSSLSVKACPFQEKPVDVNALWRSIVNVLPRESCDQILTDYAVEGPALVQSRYFLPHSCEKSLGVEEAGDPENLRSAMEAPAFKLAIALKKLSVPESKCS